MRITRIRPHKSLRSLVYYFVLILSCQKVTQILIARHLTPHLVLDKPSGCFFLHSQSVRRIEARSGCAGCQPRRVRAFSALAISREGSPGRGGSIFIAIGCPVTWRAVSMTSRTE